MFHFESSSRETDVQEWEKDRLLDRWEPITAADPYSNPHLRHGSPRLSAQLNWMIRRRPNLPKVLTRRRG